MLQKNVVFVNFSTICATVIYIFAPFCTTIIGSSSNFLIFQAKTMNGEELNQPYLPTTEDAHG